MPDVNNCQICGAPAPPVPGRCDGVTGYRLMRDPWAPVPSFLDGNLHFSCIAKSEKKNEFLNEFTHMLQAGHEEVPSLDGSPPPLTRMGLSMTEIFSGSESSVFQSILTDRWMVVRHDGSWTSLRHRDLLDIARGAVPRSPADVTVYRLPVDIGEEVGRYNLPELLTALGVADRYGTSAELERIEYECLDYYAPKRILEYAACAPLDIPDEARAFLTHHAESYTPVSYEDEEGA